MGNNTLSLFGGAEKWSGDEWTSSDDRVRGGKSQSYLDISTSGCVARFHGDLDIKTLGGAGFASQRTTGESRQWDLSAYDGIKIVVDRSDGKHYTFNIKDELLPRNPENGREQSSISYEYDFQIPENATLSKSSTLSVPWSAFKATYRGKEKEDAAKLNMGSIKRFGIMMRSFFGEQEGAFSLQIESISAIQIDTNADSTELDIEDNSIIAGAKNDKSLTGKIHQDSTSVPATRDNKIHGRTETHDRSMLKTSLLTLLGLSAIVLLVVRFPGAPAAGWATIVSCARKASL
ncbi:CIA30-domain-containing protein [Tothia fuscella]|uniref:CIA30-domain-containing protein n=1 Tax=Tothia fuscella TaxID=1048955 RepID=A0A9P4TXG5_9PEZI|nr:CIA30-domain-containing protein [Tothia fuscella]